MISGEEEGETSGATSFSLNQQICCLKSNYSLYEIMFNKGSLILGRNISLQLNYPIVQYFSQSLLHMCVHHYINIRTHYIGIRWDLNGIQKSTSKLIISAKTYANSF